MPGATAHSGDLVIVVELLGALLASAVAESPPRTDPRALDKAVTEGEGRSGYFYGTIPMYLADKPQTILAIEMNGEPLPIEDGAPVRLRIESQLGYKMVKWVRAIEFVADINAIGQGQGGWREDQQYYANAAGI